MSNWKLKGNEFFKQKLFKEAIECYSKYLKEEKDQKEIINTLNNRFRSYWMLKDRTRAFVDLKESLFLDPENEKTLKLRLISFTQYFEQDFIFFKTEYKSLYHSMVIGQFRLLYPSKIDSNIYQGPIPGSNWIIPNRILMSQYPGDIKDDVAEEKAKSFIDSKLKVFINLQQKEELKRFKPYETLLKKMDNNIEFISFEIPDMGIREDKDVDQFTDELILKFLKNENILIHCWGGHGRTGTISAILLGKIFFLDHKEALKRVSLAHKCRKLRNGGSSPQSCDQFQQVERILTNFNQKLNINK